jgi:hypothetical protein
VHFIEKFHGVGRTGLTVSHLHPNISTEYHSKSLFSEIKKESQATKDSATKHRRRCRFHGSLCRSENKVQNRKLRGGGEIDKRFED